MTGRINYGDPKFFSMFTDEGNERVFWGLIKLTRLVSEGRVSRQTLVENIELMQEVEHTLGHREVYDTEVRMDIARFVNENICKPNNWVGIDYFFDPLI